MNNHVVLIISILLFTVAVSADNIAHQSTAEQKAVIRQRIAEHVKFSRDWLHNRHNNQHERGVNVQTIVIGTSQLLTNPFNEVFAQYTDLLLNAYLYWYNFHAQGQGPFTVANGDVYDFQFLILDHHRDPDVLLQNLNELYDAGCRVIIGSLSPLDNPVIDGFLQSKESDRPIVIYTGPQDNADKPYVFVGSPDRSTSCGPALFEAARAGLKTVGIMTHIGDPIFHEEVVGTVNQVAKAGLTMVRSVQNLPTSLDLWPAHYDEYVVALKDMHATHNPDVLVIIGYIPNHKNVMDVLYYELNWMPKMLVFMPLFRGGIDDAFLENAEYATIVDLWSPDLKYSADPYFGTPADFANNYTQHNGFPPSSSDASTANVGYLAEIAIKDAVDAFNLPAGQLPTGDQIQFVFARLAVDTYMGFNRFNIYGNNILQPVSVQLRGPHVSVVDNLTFYYPDSNAVAPPDARSANIIIPAPTFDERQENLGFYTEDGEIVITAISATLIVYFIILCILLYVYRREPAMHYGSYEFLISAMIGLMMILSILFTWQLYVTEVSCIFTVWLLYIGGCLFLGSLFVKTLRIWAVVYHSSKFRNFKFTALQAAMLLALGLVIGLPFLIAITARDGVQANLVEDQLRPINNYTECVLAGPPVEAICLLVILGLLLAAVLAVNLYSYNMLKGEDMFNEFIVTIAVVFLTGICGVVLICIELVGLDRETLFYLRSTLILIGCLLFSFSILYRFYMMKTGRQLKGPVGTTTVRASSSLNSTAVPSSSSETIHGSGTSRTEI